MDRKEAGIPVPKFASVRGTVSCEVRRAATCAQRAALGHKMLRTGVALIMLAAAGVAATAQEGITGNVLPTASPSATNGAAVPFPREAPIGHRQPRVRDLPPDVRSEESAVPANDPYLEFDRELNQKLKSICRGC